jgi:hypothetical protein
LRKIEAFLEIPGEVAHFAVLAGSDPVTIGLGMSGGLRTADADKVKAELEGEGFDQGGAVVGAIGHRLIINQGSRACRGQKDGGCYNSTFWLKILITRMAVSETNSPSHSAGMPAGRHAWRIWMIAVLAVALGFVAVEFSRNRQTGSVRIPYFSIPVGKVRSALPYRIVSFHRGRADKNLIQLAAQLGFNGVQFQIEGSNENGIKDFAQRDEREHLIDFCHSLGMKVTVWVHELSDLPSTLAPDYLGPVTESNQKIWDLLDKRYEWILSTAIPHVDGLVLTVVETQVNATSTPIMSKIVKLIDDKCRKYGKTLIVRTFVWHPEELDSVMGAVKGFPDDIVVMSKVVPQDWQMRGANAAEIGKVGDRPQIVEYDVAGEYFLLDNVANCMVDLLKKQFDYGLSKNVQGICVRVDRQDLGLPEEHDNINVLFAPQEVNLWALGMLAAGATNSTQEIWDRWATYRYGKEAAPRVIEALKTTGDVVAEMLSVGPFTYGDTRNYPALPFQNIFGQNWQNWRWDTSYFPVLHLADAGDAQFVADVKKQKELAMQQAMASLAALEKAKPVLSDHEFKILYTRLLSNKIQLEYRSAVVMMAMHVRQGWQARNSGNRAATNAAVDAIKQDMAEVRRIGEARRVYPPPEVFDYLGKKWEVNNPLGISWEQIRDWTAAAEWILR